MLSTVAVLSGLGLTTPLLAAGPAAVAAPAPSTTGVQQVATQPAETCMASVHDFTTEMSKQGYWMGASNYGYGYPMDGVGYGYGYDRLPGGSGAPGPGSYATARPGYDIRILVSSANILARAGNKQGCEEVLASARTLYTRYASDLHDRGMTFADRPDRQQRQITAAQSVVGQDSAFRYDRLIEADVVSPKDEALGSVQDLVTNPQTGKIAYVVISSGGLFGIDASHTPVPWNAFKASSNGSLLVLDTTKAVLAAAPQGRGDQFTKAGQFDAESQKVEAYWAAHVKLASGK
jgi:sporulation protein YlmC with PRC-barrel domain